LPTYLWVCSKEALSLGYWPSGCAAGSVSAMVKCLFRWSVVFLAVGGGSALRSVLPLHVPSRFTTRMHDMNICRANYKSASSFLSERIYGIENSVVTKESDLFAAIRSSNTAVVLTFFAKNETADHHWTRPYTIVL
jgi:hypothetical protein